MMLQIQELELIMSTHTLLHPSSFQLNPNQKLGLVGRNGTGKSTLLKSIVGEYLPTGGTIFLQGNPKLGYLPQNAVSESKDSVWDELKSALIELNRLEQEIQNLEITAPSSTKLVEKMEQFRIMGGYQIDETIGSTLHGLGFSQSDWHTPCSSFSGGWQMRIALAKLLISNPDIAILDEPTNHLDIHARSWLAQHLSQSSSAQIIVSHDQYFLDQIVDSILEIRNKELHIYKGNFSYFIQNRSQRIESEQSAFEKQQKERAHLQNYIDRFGAKATKAKQAQSRQKKLEKMNVIEQPIQLKKEASIHFTFPKSSTELVFGFKNADIGWELPLVHNCSFQLRSHMKLALVGANGCGKSTLLHSLSGNLPLLKGNRMFGSGVRLGVYAQDVAAQLPKDHTPISHLSNRYFHCTLTKIRSTLGSLGLSSESHEKSISVLSGGEKARVVLADLILGEYNTLFLDEPTNHLDIETAHALIEGLKRFEGCILLVSHDRRLIEQVSTHLGSIQDQTLLIHEGIQPSWLTPQKTGSQKSTEPKKENKLDYQERRRKSNQRKKQEKQIRILEDEISQIELQQELLDQKMIEMSTDYEQIQKLANEQQKIEESLMEKMEQWEELSLILSEE
ncbi:MAG: hypothetical protein CL916_14380 [Deltaproteobacteria bacterium]|nr:hypothetical protein [Deltaproteobacteria bacterium]